MTLIAFLATFTGIASSVLPVLQVRKMLRNGSAAGVSVLYLSGSLTNGLVWLAYGLLLSNTAIILSNGLWAAMCVAQIATALRLNARRQEDPVSLVARAIVEHPEVAVELESLVREHEAERLSSSDTLVLRPRELVAFAAA